MVALAGSRQRLQSLIVAAPPWPLLMLAAAGWAVMFSHSLANGPMGSLCGEIDFTAGISIALWKLSFSWPNILLHAGAMTAAMLILLTADPLLHIRKSSSRVNRRNHQGMFVAAWLTVWLCGAVPIAIAAMMIAQLGDTARLWGIAFSLLIAACWQRTPWKRIALAQCHAHPVIYSKGWAGAASSLKFGFRTGRGCMMACGLMMIPAMASPAPAIAMFAIMGVAMRERFGSRSYIHKNAHILAVAAIIFFAAGIVLKLSGNFGLLSRLA